MPSLSPVLLTLALSLSATGRQIVFPPIAAVHNAQGYQTPITAEKDVLLESQRYAGLTTFANLPWVHCLSPDADVEKYDIAFLGAPFDTGTTARPGARFGPSGIRWGSRRISPAFSWSPYTHENS